jgi:hypothetical protein
LVHIDVYNKVIEYIDVYIGLIAEKLAVESIKIEGGGGKMPRILQQRI